ncbi:MAG: hypothetical protein N2517_00130 [Ignavibacteria bacterium]|nr:hypothetical protein [Ignavibacteria bacterium]
MKKIGILLGSESDFPFSLMDYINAMEKEIKAELIKIGFFKLNEALEYDIIFDRVSHEVPMYQSILKTVALSGVTVINNPYLKCLEDMFFQYSVAKKLGVKCPNVALIPTKLHSEGTTSETYKNLIYPLNWSQLFDHIGFPMFLRQNSVSAFGYSYKVYNPMEFFSAYDATGSHQMIAQQSLDCSSYYRVFVIGKKYIKIFTYDPDKPFNSRYSKEEVKLDTELRKNLEETSLLICNAFDLDFNSIDFGILENNDVYVINFYNTAPRLERNSISDEDYKWLVINTSDFLISVAENPKTPNYKTPWHNILNRKNNLGK